MVATRKLNGANFIQFVDNLQNTDWESSLKEAAKDFGGGVLLHSNLFSTDAVKLLRGIIFALSQRNSTEIYCHSEQEIRMAEFALFGKSVPIVNMKPSALTYECDFAILFLQHLDPESSICLGVCRA